MMSLFSSLQEGAGHGQEAAEAAAASPDLGQMIMHHLLDAPEWELPGFTLQLPHWEPVHLGPLTVDLSPSKHVILLLLSALIVAAVFITVGRVMQRSRTKNAPSGFANAMEAVILYFRNEVVRPNIGHGGDRFTPLILTLFFFILVMNLMGLVPWGGSATGNLSVTAGLAFVVIEFSGFLELGPRGYAKTIFFAPEGMHPAGQALMMVIMAPVEFLGKLTKPFALAVRLFANMTAGHTVILALLGLIFMFANLALGRWGIAAASVGMATAIMLLEVLVAFLQAYIFAMLTAVFIGLIRHAH
jgi:F-type H+-transporting ATPase subunit a